MSIREILCGSAYNCDKCKDNYPFKCSTKIAEEEIRKEIKEAEDPDIGQESNLDYTHGYIKCQEDIDKRLFGEDK